MRRVTGGLPSISIANESAEVETIASWISSHAVTGCPATRTIRSPAVSRASSSAPWGSPAVVTVPTVVIAMTLMPFLK
jgi:hypothetical protein